MRALSVLCLLTLTTTGLAAAATDSPTTVPSSAAPALAQLLDRGRETHSAAVVVWQDGKEIGHYYAGGRAPGPIELMSVTKSVVALGIGQLIASGRIKSVEQPVADFYPEWRQGRKKDITLRMLLDHTSGLQSTLRTDAEIAPAPDAIQLALAAELTSDPGKAFVYNNKAVNLLGDIIAKASGKPMDVFFRDGLFRDMGIRPGHWDRDKAGHPYAMSGLPLTAADLGKVGTLVINHGQWAGRQLIPANYIDDMLNAGMQRDGGVGLLWWRTIQWHHFTPAPNAFAMLRERGVPEDTVAKLERGLRGKSFDSDDAMFAGLDDVLGPDRQEIIGQQLISRGIGPYRLFKMTAGPVVAYNGNGDGGQYVVIVPSASIVAVRQIDADSDQEKPGENYEDFIGRVLELARAEGRLPPIPAL